MTQPYDPSLDQPPSSTPDSSAEDLSDYYFYYYYDADGNKPVCHDYGINILGAMRGVAYHWNGLPVRSDINDSVNTPIAASMILCGFLGLALNLYCVRVILKNKSISKAVKCYQLIDCYCRLSESCTKFYRAHCALTWECVNADGYPFSGLLVNMIITAFQLGMTYSMQMIGNGLCVNRIFAVFFDGLYYSRMEKIALPHGLILWAIPCIVYCYEIGALTEAATGFMCYGGWFFNPLEYSNVNNYVKDAVTYFLVFHFDQMMYVVLGITMVLDLLTLWKVRKLRKLSDSKRRSDVRLSIMLVTTHFITICFLVSLWLVNNLLMHMYPIDYYLILEASPFLVHCVLGIVVIHFNLPPKRDKPTAPTTNVTTVTVSQPSSKTRTPRNAH